MRYALITDDTVEKLYGESLCHHLTALGLDIQLFSFPAGESSKTRATKEKLEDALLLEDFGRDTTIIALGGGVVTDLAGFLAATFCRGVKLILIPTTLLAMVDAAIGGKTGVNTDLGKNMIGAFYAPDQFFICPEFLKTLPEKEWFNGKVEMLKAGLIADADFFHNFSKIPLRQTIERAIEIKRRIIARDPYEKQGLRSILNVGHTLGHSFETLSNYQIPHGEAVAAGIVLEAEISHEMGILNSQALDLIQKTFPPIQVSFDFEALWDALQRDKKTVNGCPRFALLQDIGTPFAKDGAYCTEVSRLVLKKVLLSSHCFR